MGRKHLLDAYQNNIFSFFNNSSEWAFTEFKLHDVLEKQRFKGELPFDKGPRYIIDYLKKKSNYSPICSMIKRIRPK